MHLKLDCVPKNLALWIGRHGAFNAFFVTLVESALLLKPVFAFLEKHPNVTYPSPRSRTLFFSHKDGAGLVMDDEYADESFSSEDYEDESFDDGETDPAPLTAGPTSLKTMTMRPHEPTEKIMSIDALGDLMSSLDNQLALGAPLPERSAPSPLKSESPPRPEASTFGVSQKYQEATSNVKSMSDLDDLMSALDQYDDPDMTAPRDVIEAGQVSWVGPLSKRTDRVEGVKGGLEVSSRAN